MINAIILAVQHVEGNVAEVLVIYPSLYSVAANVLKL